VVQTKSALTISSAARAAWRALNSG
jgi:hypothetical protein